MRLAGFILGLFFAYTVSAQETGKSVDMQNPKAGDYFYVPEYISVWCQGIKVRPSLAQAIDRVLDSMRLLPNWKFRLEVHTDCRAPAFYNDSLTQIIADTILAYVYNQGIPTWQIEAKGMGESMLLLEKCKCERTDPGNQICDEREHQMNRRLVIRLMEKLEPHKVQDFNSDGPLTLQYKTYPFYDSLGHELRLSGILDDIARFPEAYFTIYVVKEKGISPWLTRKNQKWRRKANSICHSDLSPSRINVIETNSGEYGIKSGYVLRIDSFTQKRKLMAEFGISGDTDIQIGDYQYYPEKCEWEVCTLGGINWTSNGHDSLYNLYVIITGNPFELEEFEFTYGKYCLARQDTSGIANLKAYVERIQPYFLPHARVKEIFYIYKPVSTRPYLYILQPRKE